MVWRTAWPVSKICLRNLNGKSLINCLVWGGAKGFIVAKGYLTFPAFGGNSEGVFPLGQMQERELELGSH